MHAAPDTRPEATSSPADDAPYTDPTLAPARAEGSECGPAIATLLELCTPAEASRLRALLAAWRARLLPVDAAEEAAVEAIVAATWRRERLVALEARTIDRLTRAEPLGELPTPAALGRALGRVDRERVRAEEELCDLRDLRPPLMPIPGLDPARLEWLAERLRDGRLKPRNRPAAERPWHPAHRAWKAARDAAATLARRAFAEQAAAEPPAGEAARASRAAPRPAAAGAQGAPGSTA